MNRVNSAWRSASAAGPGRADGGRAAASGAAAVSGSAAARGGGTAAGSGRMAEAAGAAGTAAAGAGSTGWWGADAPCRPRNAALAAPMEATTASARPRARPPIPRRGGSVGGASGRGSPGWPAGSASASSSATPPGRNGSAPWLRIAASTSRSRDPAEQRRDGAPATAPSCRRKMPSAPAIAPQPRPCAGPCRAARARGGARRFPNRSGLLPAGAGRRAGAAESACAKKHNETIRTEMPGQAN